MSILGKKDGGHKTLSVIDAVGGLDEDTLILLSEAVRHLSGGDVEMGESALRLINSHQSLKDKGVTIAWEDGRLVALDKREEEIIK